MGPKSDFWIGTAPALIVFSPHRFSCQVTHPALYFFRVKQNYIFKMELRLERSPTVPGSWRCSLISVNTKHVITLGAIHIKTETDQKILELLPIDSALFYFFRIAPD
jgi:hypothetical protein